TSNQPPGSPQVRIEAVTVCVGYADFLAQTMPRNLPIFDKWVIVTTPDDDETRELCRKFSVHCITTRDFYRDGATFNKARGIVLGLDQLSHDSWVLHMDADIVLPTMTRLALKQAHLDPECLYGCDRILVQDWDGWQRILQSGYLQHDYHCRVNAPIGFELGTRWAS